jgi:uncharacterized membrane protein
MNNNWEIISYLIGIVGILLTFIGLVLMVNFQFNENREKAKEKKDERIRKFIDEYVSLVKNHQNSGFKGAIEAGIIRLTSDREIETAFDEIYNRGYKHPLGRYKGKIISVGVKNFFDYVVSKDINLAFTDIDGIVKNLPTRPTDKGGGVEERQENTMIYDLWRNPWFEKLLIPLIVGVILLLLPSFVGWVGNIMHSKSNILSHKTTQFSEILTRANVYSSALSQGKKVSLFTFTISSTSELEDLMSHLRATQKLRKLTLFEEGKNIGQTSEGTYFYLSPAYLQNSMLTSSNYCDALIANSPIHRKKGYYSDFELHYLVGGELFLLGFISPYTASQITKLDGLEEIIVPILASPFEDMKTLVVLPINRIVKASYRSITTDEDRYVQVLDVVIK